MVLPVTQPVGGFSAPPSFLLPHVSRLHGLRRKREAAAMFCNAHHSLKGMVSERQMASCESSPASSVSLWLTPCSYLSNCSKVVEDALTEPSNRQLVDSPLVRSFLDTFPVLPGIYLTAPLPLPLPNSE